MSNKFLEFQEQVEAVKNEYRNGDITETERDERIRQICEVKKYADDLSPAF